VLCFYCLFLLPVFIAQNLKPSSFQGAIMTDSNRAILLVNLGSPDSTSVPDVKKYLDEFLMDARVLDFPTWFRSFLVRGIILNVRPKKSAAAYREIWWDEGSPLVVISKRVQKALQARVDIPVGLAMRYQNPSTEAGIVDLVAKSPNLSEILLVPLYPHYAMATTETVALEARDALKRLGLEDKIGLKILPPFYEHPAYLEALTKVTAEHLTGEEDQVLFSYHGIPERHVKKSDCTGSHCLKVENCCEVASPAHQFCYRHQLTRTTQEVARRLGLKPEKFSISFQSRLGGGWLQPFTDKRLEAFPKEGVKKLAVICPAFVSDCLETLEEINGEGRETFMHAGGEKFTYIPCMNDHPAWIAALDQLCTEAWDAPKPFLETNSLIPVSQRVHL
jgi:protoporphyrin/coproporphyrin ferrochelatase